MRTAALVVFCGGSRIDHTELQTVMKLTKPVYLTDLTGAPYNIYWGNWNVGLVETI